MDRIIVLDFGGQYTQLIAKRVRQSDVFSEILPYDTSLDSLKDAKGIILSGGPDSVYEKDAPAISRKIFELGIPVLGICYGMQLMVHLFGGKIISGTVREYGRTAVSVLKEDGLLPDVPEFFAWMSHGDSADMDDLPEGFVLTAKTASHAAAIADIEKKLYGVQFHPEVTHSEYGKEIIDNFVHGICGCDSSWNTSNLIADSIEYVKKTVGKNNILCFVSGGVDSSYVAALLKRTEGIGKVYNVYIEALMRLGETDEIISALSDAGIDDLIVYKAEDEFIKALDGVSDPEKKRNIIGNLFGRIQERIIKEHGLSSDDTFLAQGTLYTDLIESGKGVGKIAANIKSHHNVNCEFIDELKKKNRIVEPNRMIFKDEVRAAAKEIGLPEKIYNRQPFPGPGLGIRIVDASSPSGDFENLAAQVSSIAQEHGMMGFLVPVRTVGVQGDSRTYSFLAVLQGKQDWKTIRKAAAKIPATVHDVNRVVYYFGDEHLTQKDFMNTITTNISHETIGALKHADYIARQILGDSPEISQTAVILFGLDLFSDKRRAVSLRSAITDDFMTITPAVLGRHILWETAEDIKKKIIGDDISAFFYDVTDKPPSTFCWE